QRWRTCMPQSWESVLGNKQEMRYLRTQRRFLRIVSERQKMMAQTQHVRTRSSYTQPNSVLSAWLIAKRQMLEALRDRSTLIMTGFLLVIQAVVMLSLLQPLAQGHLSPKEAASTGALMVFGLLYVGLLPVTPAVGIASGVFAGDKERGSLTPLLVTPLSNTAIFAGKVLGAVLPALIYAL